MDFKCWHIWIEDKSDDQESTHEIEVSTHGDSVLQLKNEGLKCWHTFVRGWHMEKIFKGFARNLSWLQKRISQAIEIHKSLNLFLRSESYLSNKTEIITKL